MPVVNQLGSIELNQATRWCLERLQRWGMHPKSARCYHGLASGYAGFSVKNGGSTFNEGQCAEEALKAFKEVAAPGVVAWLRSNAPDCVPAVITVDWMLSADGKGGLRLVLGDDEMPAAPPKIVRGSVANVTSLMMKRSCCTTSADVRPTH